MINIKRVYEDKTSEEFWVLVDRLWPRGIKKDKIDMWLKDVAPSEELRKEYHQNKNFEDFKEKYLKELKSKSLKEILELIKTKNVKLVYASKEPLNNATILKEYLDWILEKQT